MINAPDLDHNGLDLGPVRALFTDEERAAAKRLARAHRNLPGTIDRDPAGQGWRWLRDAKIALRGIDPGPAYRETPSRPAPNRRVYAKGSPR